MAEVYQGLQSSSWRHHLGGSWLIALQSITVEPWLSSEMAWLTAQSLYTVTLRNMNESHAEGFATESMSNTTAVDLSAQASKDFIDSVLQRDDCGFTIGTKSKSIICLRKVVALVKAMQLYGLSAELNYQFNTICHELAFMVQYSAHSIQFSYTSMDAAEDNIELLHDYIFLLGVTIYLYKHVVASTPIELLPYVSKLLQATKQIAQLSAIVGQVQPMLTVWPIFVAATETYRQVDQDIVRDWMEQLAKSGIGNRKDLIRTIETVWACRHQKLKDSRSIHCVDASMPGRHEEEVMLGSISINWKDVQLSLGLDLILVWRITRMTVRLNRYFTVDDMVKKRYGYHVNEALRTFGKSEA